MTNAENFLGKEVSLVFDRPVGSKHPKRDFTYPINYGYVPGTKMPDGEELDAYYLGTDKPAEKADGICIAIVHRTNDDDDKLIVAPSGQDFSDEEIEKSVDFQEKWYEHILIRHSS